MCRAHSPSRSSSRVSSVVRRRFVCVAELRVVLSWGRLSDRIGRRPVLLTGCFGLIFATILFGFARTFWAMIFARALSGALNGNVAVLKRFVDLQLSDYYSNTLALPAPWGK